MGDYAGAEVPPDGVYLALPSARSGLAIVVFNVTSVAEDTVNLHSVAVEQTAR